MYILSAIILTFIISCYGDSDFNARARNFSLELVESTDLDHAVIGSFCVWSEMASAAIWTHGDSHINNQLSKTIVLPRSKNSFIEDYVKLREAILNYERGKIYINIKNFIFIDNNFSVLPDFKDTMQTHFRAHIINFAFQDSVAAANTASRIVRAEFDDAPLFFPNDFTNMSMIMANALKFEDHWTAQFNKSDTTTETIQRDEKYYIMHKKLKIPHTNMEEIKADAMELSFGKNGKYCMLIIKPHSGVNLRKTYKLLAKVNLVDIMDKLQEKEIDLALPRFKIKTQVLLNKPLKVLGITDVFESGGGHFPEISSDDIFISLVEHYAQITVDELGIKAFATSPGRIFLKNTPNTAKTSNPFIFFILEKPTVTVLFSGLYSRKFGVK